MAGLFGQALVFMCVSTSGQYNTACNIALDAGTQQAGIKQQADNVENKSLDLAKKTAVDNLGTTPVAAVSSGVFIYNVYKARSIDFKLPNMGIADTVSNKITDKSYTLNFIWKW
jgi:hypothetical protein